MDDHEVSSGLLTTMQPGEQQPWNTLRFFPATLAEENQPLCIPI